MSSKVVIVYYSMTGNTRAIAEELKWALGADIEEIRERRPRRGFGGVLKALAELLLHREPPVLPPQQDLTQYDLVVIGGPLWGGRFAAPVRVFTRCHVVNARRVALFCTFGSYGAGQALESMRSSLGGEVIATLAIAARDLAHERHRAPFDTFVAKLREVRVRAGRVQVWQATAMESAERVALGHLATEIGIVRLFLTRRGSCVRAEVVDASGPRERLLWCHEVALRRLPGGTLAASLEWRRYRFRVRVAQGRARVLVLLRAELPPPAKPAWHAPFVPPPSRRPALAERVPRNPVLVARPQVAWESQAVFNGGALRLGGRVHLVYRAVGANGQSVLGHASSPDGVNFDERDAQPIFQLSGTVDGAAPASRVDYQSGTAGPGAEDPRVVAVEDRVYLTYTHFDGHHPPAMAMTSIAAHDFLARRWNWDPPRLLSCPAEAHKNWVLFPRRLCGRYALLHGIAPRPRVAWLGDLACNGHGHGHWIASGYSNEGDNTAWDNILRGAGPPPIETPDGWLVLYHAMDRRDPGRYKLGAMLLATDDPLRVVARLPYPLLEPDARYENEGHKRGVVYCCGAVVIEEMLVLYYGGADTVVCAARLPLAVLLQELRSAATASREGCRDLAA